MYEFTAILLLNSVNNSRSEPLVAVFGAESPVENRREDEGVQRDGAATDQRQYVPETRTTLRGEDDQGRDGRPDDDPLPSEPCEQSDKQTRCRGRQLFIQTSERLL